MSGDLRGDAWRAGRRSAVAALHVVLVLVVAGCTSGGGPGTPRHIAPLTARCPAEDTAGASSTSAAPPSAAPLAEDFLPTSASYCTFGMVLFDERARGSVGPEGAGGGWRQQSVQRSTGPFDELVRALRSPPETRDGEVACPADLVAPFVITLTDATGRTATPAVPADACGRPIPSVTQAIKALTWETVETRARPTPSRSE